jgi:hypothetical protein
MSANYDYFIAGSGGSYYLMSYSGNIPSSVEEKLNSFANLPDGWDYGEGGPIPVERIALAHVWNSFLRSRGFFDTDVSPGTDGEIAIGGRLGNHYVEIILEPDSTVSVAYDRNRKQVFYKLHQQPWEAQKVVVKLMDEIWSASTLFTGTSITPPKTSGSGQLFATTEDHYRLSVLNAWQAIAETSAGISNNIMLSGAVSSANLLYFGALTQTPSRRVAR